MAAYTTIELIRVAPSPGDGKRLELELEPGEVRLGDDTYVLDPPEVTARLDVSHAAAGFAMRLAFMGELTGAVHAVPRPRARVGVEVEAREVDQPGTDDEELRSPYVSEGILDLTAWGHDALALALPAADPLPPGLRRPLRGLRRVAQRRRAGGARPPARARPAVGEAPRASVSSPLRRK